MRGHALGRVVAQQALEQTLAAFGQVAEARGDLAVRVVEVLLAGERQRVVAGPDFIVW